MHMMNGVTVFSKLKAAALAFTVIYGFCMGAGFIMLIVMAFLDLAAGSHILDTLIHMMEGVLPALQLLSALLAFLVVFSMLLDCLNIYITTYVNCSHSRIDAYIKTLPRSCTMIRGLPKTRYGRLRRRSGDINMNTSSSCAICLGYFGDEDEVRVLPNCRHYFHISCIDRWLFLCSSTNSSCPLCRATVSVVSNDLGSLPAQ